MKTMKENELMNVSGGASTKIIAGVIGIVAFLIGIVDGYFRPLVCRS